MSSSKFADRATCYRQHAEECRTIAEASEQVGIKKTLAHVAQDYEEMAQIMDKLSGVLK